MERTDPRLFVEIESVLHNMSMRQDIAADDMKATLASLGPCSQVAYLRGKATALSETAAWLKEFTDWDATVKLMVSSHG